MKKIFLTCALALASLAGINAQDPSAMMQPLPLNPKVKAGVLPNGLSYYIMHNEEPKERANFYIAQKVGSTLEEPDQLGLAHFLEHMAFNGTTNYPGKNMLNYLQSKGIRFGADINAYTAFDETVYNINNVITTDKPLMDSVLLVLHDWSGDILLEESEIDAERGVIQEEWRSRNNAQFRMYSSILPQIYEEYQYQQMPIGKMEVVMNFKPETLRAYYKKWYRPDQQGIIIVGDFDADEMEKKVIDLFSTIEMPENAAPREYPSVSDNEKPIFVSFTDPELTNLLTIISFKSDAVPFEMKNTLPVYIQEEILQRLVATMINNRLNEFAQTPDCRYAYAGVTFGNYYVSKTKDSFDIQVLAKSDSRDAVEDAMSIVTRACKTGFNEAEYERATQEMMANIEKLYNERDKTTNDALGRELCSYFTDNAAAPGIETEYQLWQMILPQMPVEAVNEFVKEILTDQDMVVVTSAPKAEGFEIVTEESMLSTLDQVMHAEYEALEEEKITEPLIPNLPVPGKIIGEVNDPKLQAEVLELSNNVTVVLKPTDFAGDEVLMYAYREGGKRLYDYEQAANVLLLGDVFETAKMGNFDNKTLKKYLAGKNVALGFQVNTYTDVLQGSSTVKDLPTLFELIYTSFTNLNPDAEMAKIALDRARPMLEMAEKNPNYIFQQQVTKTRYANNPLMQQPTIATLDAVDYPKAYELVTNALGNAADYTFIFVGNITSEVINPLIEQYIASLPTKEVVAPVYKSEINTAAGQVKNEFKQPMETPATMVYDVYSQNNLPFTVENDIMVDLVGDIIGNIFTDTLREEEGGTYSPAAGAVYNPNSGEWNILYMFSTNADQQAKLIERADSELMNLLQNGADEANFNKAKEAMIKQYEINSRKNAYWNEALTSQMRFPQADFINDYANTLNSITLDQFNQFMKNLYNGNNRIQVIMEGVQAQ
ncbi:MAG: insulinase family protein [Muribaculaceae bacterium]|nr:insulinase family protein [Muribaculaceae bacterium]